MTSRINRQRINYWCVAAIVAIAGNLVSCASLSDSTNTEQNPTAGARYLIDTFPFLYSRPSPPLPGAQPPAVAIYPFTSGGSTRGYYPPPAYASPPPYVPVPVAPVDPSKYPPAALPANQSPTRGIRIQPLPSAPDTQAQAALEAQEQAKHAFVAAQAAYAERNKLVQGAFAFNTPSEMMEQQTTNVQLIVTFNNAMKYFLGDKISSPGTTTVEDAMLSKYKIIATLEEPPNFTVKPSGPVTQAVIDGVDPTWMWTITANKAGDAELLLRIQSVLSDGTVDTPIIRKIKVNAKPVPPVSFWEKIGPFAEKNWDKLWTLLILPFIYWVIKLVKGKPPAAQ